MPIFLVTTLLKLMIMQNVLNKTPWAVLSIAIQLFGLWAAYYLYTNDYGYGSGRAFSYSLSFSYFVLGTVGTLGIVSALLGMSISILKERWLVVLPKLILVFVPCLFLSVLWFYTWLALLAWV